MATSWTLAWRNVCVSLHAPLLAENALVVIDRWIVQKWKPFHEKQDPYHLPNKNWNELIAPIGSKITVFGGTETFLVTQQISFWIIVSVFGWLDQFLVDWISFCRNGVFFGTDPFMEKHIGFCRNRSFFWESDCLEIWIIFGGYLLRSGTVLGEKKYFWSNGSVFGNIHKFLEKQIGIIVGRNRSVFGDMDYRKVASINMRY